MPMPTVTLGSGTASIDKGEEFAWVTNVTGSITVDAQIMPDGNPWFTPNPCSFTGPASGPLPDGSNVVTAADEQSPPGGWSYTSNIPQGNGHVIVHLHVHKKAG